MTVLRGEYVYTMSRCGFVYHRVGRLDCARGRVSKNVRFDAEIESNTPYLSTVSSFFALTYPTDKW